MRTTIKKPRMVATRKILRNILRNQIGSNKISLAWTNLQKKKKQKPNLLERLLADMRRRKNIRKTKRVFKKLAKQVSQARKAARNER